MKIIVNPHTLELQKTDDVNSGEYNIQKCEFVFSSEYEGLTKMAIFSNEESSFKTMITDNECIIPYEILETEGTLGLGVYGYTLDGESLVKRYSPKPVFFNVELGSYQLAQEGEQPSQDIIEQILAQLESQGEDIIALQNNLDNLEDNVIPTLATKSEIPTKTSQLTNDSDFAYTSDIPDVSGFITKDVEDLTYYTKTSSLSQVALTGSYNNLIDTPDLSVYATTTQLGNETTARENADIGLQGQIDAITSSSDVKDIVGTYQDLQNYDTSSLGNNDVIKVLQDSTHSNAMTYYRWVITGGVGAWSYIGQEGPYYTKSEIDTTLQPYVKNTDYATSSKGGVIKPANGYATDITNDGKLYALVKTYAEYTSGLNNTFISKGTLENVITGKDLTTKSYVDGLVGDINTALDTINGEVI
jgi:hypothetical protein